jgi:hypothetical protein
MRVRSTIKWSLAAGILLLLAGSALAQPSDGQVGFERKTQLTPEEQLTQSDGHLTRMRQAGESIRRQLEKAREERDVVKALCLNDKLSQVDVAVRSAVDRQANLRGAVNRRDVEASNHEFTILTVLKQRTDQLAAEANQCIGDITVWNGQTTITTQVDPTIPSEDPTEYPPTDPTLVSAPPQCISCAQ